MVALDSILVIIIGFMIGSFLNVCIYRIPRGESIVYPPSHCVACDGKIKWYDLIPIFSYILLRGRCRYCGEKISIRYPIIEFITGILFFITYLEYGPSIEFMKYVVLIAILIVVGMIDLNTTDVYFSTSIIGIVFGIIFILLSAYYNNDFKQYIFGALFGGAVLTAIAFFTKAMGLGDVEICFYLGLFLGIKLTVISICFSFIFGSIISILLILLKKKGRKDYIAFGPFIALASIFTVFFGNKIIMWYFQNLMY
ncbi:prepilin peptidase [Clostridium scatologenes]|uniref:Peptidase A24A domain protein n=1 Tax=Clostridium scatologenes TaxID=1548 RepID=A0A0E3JRI2_CLOSL|nr:A24 family peptidase [Clostridium scatologenes]AKA71729.1 peptidase A24A domain protein [Clostridium scatologenes]